VVDTDRIAVVGGRVSGGLTLAEAEGPATTVAAQIDDTLAAFTGDLACVNVAQRLQQPLIERQARLQRRHDQVEVVDRLHSPIL
jgi:hypothetical protein